MSHGVNIFWDNSNIFIGAKKAAHKQGEGFYQTSLRVQFDNLYALARAGRDVNAAYCVGSILPAIRTVWDQIRQLGAQVEIYERGAGSGREQAVDQALQTHILRAGYDYDEPQVAVVLTGDGAGYDEGVGFFADLERVHRDKGWGIEVLSWEGSCKVAFRKWAERVGVFIPLDNFYTGITFVEGLRSSTPLTLTHRAKASPAR